MLQLGSPGAQTAKPLPAVQETQARSLGQEDPLEEALAPHSSSLAGESHGPRSLAGYKSMKSQRVEYDSAVSLSFFLSILQLNINDTKKKKEETKK